MFITEKQLQPAQNNFSPLRLLAALFVFISHSFYVRNIGERELLDVLTNGRYSFSSMGMIIFFSMSGFLVCKSLLTTNSIAQYAVNRFLRIWPAFAVCTVLMILLPGLIFTTLPPLTFLTHHQTLFFLFKNLSLTGTSLWLPGVFNNEGINASIWSIPVEVRLYVVLLLLFVINKKWLKLAVLIAITVLLATQLLVPSNTITHTLGRTTYQTITLGTFFLIGAAFYLYRDKIPFKLSIWFVLFIPWLICYIWVRPLAITVDYFFFSYSFLGIVFFAPVIPFGKIDISYGFYLYAFPIQKALQVVAGAQLNFIGYLFGCALCITIAALFSWFLVEKKALQLKAFILPPSAASEKQHK